MSARATWKGFLKISLVNIPIKVFPATEASGTLSFNQLHGACQTRSCGTPTTEMMCARSLNVVPPGALLIHTSRVLHERARRIIRPS